MGSNPSPPTKIKESKCWHVEIGDSDYLRFGPDNWYKWYGESLESEYSCENLEKVFREANNE